MKKIIIASAFALAVSTSMASAAPKVDCGFYGKNWGAIQAWIKDNFPDGVNSYAQAVKYLEYEEGVGVWTQRDLGGVCGIGSEAP
jgi:hypothetical protein